MPRLKEHKFQHPDGAECVISLSLDDAAIMENCLEFEIDGKYRKHSESEWISCKFVVRLDAENNLIEIVQHERVVGTINLEFASKYFEELYEEVENSEYWARLKDLFPDNDAAMIEELINSIPVSDPIFGCLIRAGLSTTIGQLIQCNSQITESSSVRQRIWKILRCLGINSFVIVSKFTLRTGKCALSFGWL